MLKCPNCGSEVRETASFCAACGYPLQAPKAANASPQLESNMPQKTGQGKLKEWVNAVGKGWLIVFAVLFAIILPSCFFLGFYTNRILWMLGLR